MVLEKSEWCKIERLWRENDGLNNGTRQNDVTGPDVCFGFFVFFDQNWLVRVPLFNLLFGVDS